MLIRAKGFGLVDVVVGIGLMLLLFVALFGVLRASLALSTLAKAKAAAVDLASTQMEYLRGFAYDSLGTVGGIPAGSVPQNATTTVDGVTYTTRTLIEYYDDPADGLGASDTDHVTTDYKIGKVVVSYTLSGQTKSVSLISNFAPPGLETSTGGGTLSLHIVDASGADLSGASVEIVDASTSPTIDFTTFSNAEGIVLIGGAATSSSYQTFISKSGYSSAQTYARNGQNANPNPGYFTVAEGQTTSGTFAIDQLATLVLALLSPATTTAFTDSFTNVSDLGSQTNTQVAGGALELATNALSGSAESISITPGYLSGWGIASATISAPAGTSANVQIFDGSGNLVPDAALAGNSSGFTSFPVSLTGLSTSTYPALILGANLTSNSTTTTPQILDWSLSHTSGPLPVPSSAYTLTGAKTIGTTSGGAPIYKTTVSGTSGADGTSSQTLEWDSYTPSGTSAAIIESCAAAPFYLAPGSTTNISLLLGSPVASTLPVSVETAGGVAIAGARVVLTKTGYAATIASDACGLAYFTGLSSGTYSITASATGHATTTAASIPVSGLTATSTVTLP